MNRRGKIVVFVVLPLLIAAVFGINHLIASGTIKSSQPAVASAVPDKVTIPDLPDSPPAAHAALAPSAIPKSVAGKQPIAVYMMAWNSQMGFIGANGGVDTAPGSIMAQHGVKVHIEHEDDTNKMQQKLFAFAQSYKNGNPNPTDGAPLCVIMGDGAPFFLKGLNDNLKKLGMVAKVYNAFGFSYGEDKYMDSPKVRENPQNARGTVVAVVILDGDQNIVLNFANDNNIPVNADLTTYDPDAINFVAAEDFVDAGTKYNAGYCEERKVKKGGKVTTETKKVCVNAISSWTPVDVNVAEGKGGIVDIVSTRDYGSQMPSVIIGIDTWMQAHRPEMEQVFAAGFEGADAIKSSDVALDKAAELSASVWGAHDGPYWKKYFKGVKAKDKQGLDVQLGGSRVANLADVQRLFGLIPGKANAYAAVYTTFGNRQVKLYHDKFPEFYPIGEVLDTSFIKGAEQRVVEASKEAPADMPKYSVAKDKMQRVIARRDLTIQFETGSATLTEEGQRQVDEILDGSLVGEFAINIDGYTDNVGSAKRNEELSLDRALAVKKYLERKSPEDFPRGRIHVAGYGPKNPVESNSTPEGREKNRRVEVTYGDQ